MEELIVEEILVKQIYNRLLENDNNFLLHFHEDQLIQHKAERKKEKKVAKSSESVKGQKGKTKTW